VSNEQDRATRFVPILKNLAEGRLDRQDWLAWWHEHAAEVEAAVPAGWYLRLKMGNGHEGEPNRQMESFVRGASYILSALKITHTPTDKFKIAWQADFAAYSAAQDRQRKEQQKQLKPVLERIKAQFPKFAALLKRKFESASLPEAGATDEELHALENSLGIQLPGMLATLLRASRQIQLEGLTIGTHLFFHGSRGDAPAPSSGMLCFADYWLDADGDQMLIDPKELPDDDPPVYYYAHSVPEVRSTKKTFSAWLESLARSPMFRG
jgi:hypothetical protein